MTSYHASFRALTAMVRLRPQPADGYTYLAQLPGETHLEDIPHDLWDIQVMTRTPEDRYVFLGQTTIDFVTCHVWWSELDELFIAQSTTFTQT